MRIEGRNPIREALRAGYPVASITVAEGAETKGSLAEILDLARLAHVRVARADRHDLDDLAEGHSHQGIIAEVADYSYVPWQRAIERSKIPFLLALDGITDPQNAGSLIRTAYLMGVDAVLLPARRAAPVTASVAKASAGAIWHIAVDQVTNLERTLADCRKRGLWIVGLDGTAKTQVSDCPVLSEPCVLVIGSENRGMSRLLRERADVLVKIPQTGKIDSLGAAAAGAIALYAVAQSRSLSAAGSQLSASAGENKTNVVPND